MPKETETRPPPSGEDNLPWAMPEDAAGLFAARRALRGGLESALAAPSAARGAPRAPAPSGPAEPEAGLPARVRAAVFEAAGLGVGAAARAEDRSAAGGPSA